MGPIFILFQPCYHKIKAYHIYCIFMDLSIAYDVSSNLVSSIQIICIFPNFFYYILKYYYNL